MKHLFKSLIVLASIALTSCGYSLKEVYAHDSYNSPLFENNYYRKFSDALKDAQPVENRTLTRENDFVFEGLNDSNYLLLESNEENRLSASHYFDRSLGMAKIDDSFKYGIMSKLFDGWWECGGHYELARIQIDTEGFSHSFTKQCRQEPGYFMMSFQNSVGYRYDAQNRYVSNSKAKGESLVCDITLNINFYMLNSNIYTKKTYSYNIAGKEANCNDYCFFGFKIKDNIDISTCKGISFDYKINSIIYNGEDKTEEFNGDEIGHALWIYEVYMPNSTWH